ncbi:MAG TPA: hypothetical protein VKA21_15840 [Candidatus Binatia bacterium]|nr:hypothetical protein [Candidatus Binatia bacterium]
MRSVARALVLFAALAPACGHKNAPVAPELVRPEAPEKLTAIATPDGVRLGWLRPTRYSGGGRMNDLGRFVIERAADDAAFAKVGELALDDQIRFRKERRLEWTDTAATTGTRYLYRVTAVTLDGYRSAPAGPVAVQYGVPTEPSPSER